MIDWYMPSAIYNLFKLVYLNTPQDLGRRVQVPELKLRPFLALDTSHIQLRYGKRDLIVHVLIEDTHEDHRQ
jgi:hypothetical protein